MSQRLILRKLSSSFRNDHRSLANGFLVQQRNYATKQRITSEIAKVLAALDENQKKSTTGSTMRPVVALDMKKSEMSHPEPAEAVRRPRNSEGLMLTTDKILEQAIEYQLSRQYSKAELYYSFVLEQDPYNVTALFNKGLAEQHQHKLMDALKSFNRAIELDFNDVDTILARANLLYKMKWYEEALSDYDNVLDKDAKNVLALKSRGSLQFELGRYKEALIDYINLIKAYPMVSEHHVSCAVVYQKLGKRDDALQEYSEAITLNPLNIYALEQRGSLLYVMGDLQGALKDFSKAIELNPKNALPYLNRALTFKQMGNRLEAVSDLRKALDVDPAFKTAEDELAQLM